MPTDACRTLRLSLALWSCLMAPALAAPPPAAPAHLRAAPGDGAVTLAWDPIPGATVYRVLFAEAPGGPYALAAQVKATRYVARGLTNWATHYYVVAAVRAGLEGTPSAEAEATPEGPPAAPQGLRAKPGHTQVSLVWAAVPGADGYDVYRSQGAGVRSGTDGPALTSPVASGVARCVWTDGGLTDGAVYCYRVVAVVSAAHHAALTGRSRPAARAPTGPASPAVAATPSAALPLAPTSVSASAGDALVTLAWEAGTSEASEAKPAKDFSAATGTTYRVYRGTRSGGEGTAPWKDGLAAASLSSADVRNGTTYYYLVTAVTAAGESAYGPERSATPSAASAGPGVAVASALPNAAGGTGGGGAGQGAGGLANGLGGGSTGGASAAPTPAAPSPATGGETPTSGGGSTSPTPPRGGQPPVIGQPIPGPPAGPPAPIPTPGPTPTPPSPTPPSPTPPPVTGGGGGGGSTGGGGGGGGSTGNNGPTAPGSPGGDLPSPPTGSNPAFYLTLSGSQLGLRAGVPVTETLTFVSQQGLLGPIHPFVSGLPAGATAMFYPSEPALTAVVDGQSVASTTLYLFGPSSPLPVGPYALTLGATLGSPPSPQASGTLTVYGS